MIINRSLETVNKVILTTPYDSDIYLDYLKNDSKLPFDLNIFQSLKIDKSRLNDYIYASMLVRFSYEAKLVSNLLELIYVDIFTLLADQDIYLYLSNHSNIEEKYKLMESQLRSNLSFLLRKILLKSRTNTLIHSYRYWSDNIRSIFRGKVFKIYAYNKDNLINFKYKSFGSYLDDDGDVYIIVEDRSLYGGYTINVNNIYYDHSYKGYIDNLKSLINI